MSRFVELAVVFLLGVASCFVLLGTDLDIIQRKRSPGLLNDGNNRDGLAAVARKEPVTTAAPRATQFDAKPTLCLIAKNPGGFGNKVYGLVGYIALARATDRIVSLSGPSVIWAPFWEADYPHQACNPNDVDLRCDANSLKNHESPCARALFDFPDKVIQIEITQAHGDEMVAATSHPLFKKRYMEKVLAEYPSVPISWFDVSEKIGIQGRFEFYHAIELPRILNKPTTEFAAVIQKFEQLHNLSSDHDSRYAFDLALHVRVCVDCGWAMSRKLIAADIQCAIEAYSQSNKFQAKGAKIFVTSDTRKYLDDIMQEIPPGAKVVENIAESFIHTADTKSRRFETQALPYLDSYLLSRSRLIGSCWTSFGYLFLRLGK